MLLSEIVVRSLAVRGGDSLGQLKVQVKDASKGCLRCPSRRTLAKKALVWEECGDRRSMGDGERAVCEYGGKVPAGAKDT